MSEKGTRPEDVLPDGRDSLTISGVAIRKGTIAAAMRNIERLETGSQEERQAALATIEDLAPGLVVIGVHRHFICRNPQVEAILAAAAAKLDSGSQG